MTQATFNTRFLNSAKAPDGVAQIDFYDGKPPFLGLRVSQRVKTWFVQYRLNGRQRRLKLGRYPDLSLADARQLGFEARRQIALGVDPQDARKTIDLALTFYELSQRYLEQHAKPNKRSWRFDQQLLKKHILPGLGAKRLNTIERGDIIQLIDSAAICGGQVSNRVLALINTIFNFSIDRDILQSNPAHRLKPRFKAQARERVLTPEEIRQVWGAMSSHQHTSARIMKLMLLTGQRGGEVRQMRGKDLDFSSDCWTIPPSISKNKRSHRVPLTSSAKSIIKSHQQSGEFVFSVKKDMPVSRASFSKHVIAVALDSGVDFRGHDLRRTAASCMASIGVQRFIIQRLLNHTDSSVTAVYDRHSYDAEKRQALEQYEAWLTETIF